MFQWGTNPKDIREQMDKIIADLRTIVGNVEFLDEVIKDKQRELRELNPQVDAKLKEVDELHKKKVALEGKITKLTAETE